MSSSMSSLNGERSIARDIPFSLLNGSIRKNNWKSTQFSNYYGDQSTGDAGEFLPIWGDESADKASTMPGQYQAGQGCLNKRQT